MRMCDAAAITCQLLGQLGICQNSLVKFTRISDHLSMYLLPHVFGALCLVGDINNGYPLDDVSQVHGVNRRFNQL